MAKKIGIVADYKIRLNGVTIGEAKKISVPKITQAKQTHTGAVGDYDISIGQVEKLESSCVVLSENFLHYFSAGLLNDAELDFVEAVKYGSEAEEGDFEFKGILDIEVNDSERKGFKEVTLSMSCNRAFHTVNGVPAYHIDFENDICMLGTTDTMEKVRTIVGA